VGVGGEIAVVVEVPESEVSTAVSAIRSGVVDLAAVPITEADPRDAVGP
jgi:FixJ family two-component response regulator